MGENEGNVGRPVPEGDRNQPEGSGEDATKIDAGDLSGMSQQESHDPDETRLDDAEPGTSSRRTVDAARDETVPDAGDSTEYVEPPPAAPPQPQDADRAPGYDWSQPPAPSSRQSLPDQPSGVMDHVIPTKNPAALIGYYLGCFAVVPCFSPFLGPAALICGIKGLRAVSSTPGLPGKGHAVTAVVLGSLACLASVVVVVFVVYGLFASRAG